MKMRRKEILDLSVVMPCLDEENTVGICIDEARGYIERKGLKAEIIVADNGSTDKSAYIAQSHGAVVVHVPNKGYGRALRAGLSCTRGKVIVFADCDTTYDLSSLDRFYDPLSQGECDVMIGDRFAGGIDDGAMPAVHPAGIKFLSALGRAAFGVKVYDFHCGIRGLTRSAAEKMQLRSPGMEFATEFIAEAAEKHLRIEQCPAVLRKCRYNRTSKLHTFRDGLRHMLYIISRFVKSMRKKQTP